MGLFDQIVGVQIFQTAGLGDVVQPWIETGQNLPISADMIHQVLGSETMRRTAEQTGLPIDQMSNLISQHLPQSVDEVTPTGEIRRGSTRPTLERFRDRSIRT